MGPGASCAAPQVRTCGTAAAGFHVSIALDRVLLVEVLDAACEGERSAACLVRVRVRVGVGVGVRVGVGVMVRVGVRVRVGVGVRFGSGPG